MRKATLTRYETSDVGTFGRLLMDDRTNFVTGELPWRDNKTGISCVPVGVYTASAFKSPKHGAVYLLKGVPGRSMVEIHSANYMGDKAKGYKCELEGCIALGIEHKDIAGQAGVTSSRVSIATFLKNLDGEDLEITIENKPE